MGATSKPLPDLESLSALSLSEKKLLLAEIEGQLSSIEKGRKFFSLYPATGPLSREHYPRHISFFAAGAQHDERAIMGGNRSGKTTAAGFELVAHMSGEYPEWWNGRRWDRPVVAWIAGENVRALRDSLQIGLLGPAE
jgi:hypothetical protein